MTTERELISHMVAVIADAHDECLDGMHTSARERLMDLIREGNAYLQQSALAAPVAPALVPVKRATVSDARDYMNMNDKAFWVLGWNECAEEVNRVNGINWIKP